MRPKEFERHNLEEQLSDILHLPLAIIVSPSGYGKTTMVRSFLSKNQDLKCIWLSIGRSEVDETWVWNKLCDRIKDAGIDIYEQLKELGLPKTTRDADYFIRLVREHVKVPMCIVLDDFHECDCPAINQLITNLVYEEVPGLHIILISCVNPNLAFEEMLLKGYCVLINQQDFVLSKEETEKIFAINEISLSQEELNRMYRYTDGWISAVYLSLFDYKKVGQFGYFASAAHLLKTAIYEKLPIPLQEFCMKMSLFGEFTLEEAVYITENNIQPITIRDMIEGFGFLHYNILSQKYEMHTLLRNVAVQELQNMGIDIAKLYLRSGEYSEKTGDFIKAIVSYHKAGENTHVLEILSGEKRTIIYEEAPAIVDEFFSSIQLESKIRYPIAYLSYIYFIVIKEDALKGLRLIEEIRGEYEKNPLYQNDSLNLWGELLILDALLHFNNLEDMNQAIKKASELLNHKPSGIFKQELLTYGTPTMTLLYYKQSGELKNTIEREKIYSKYYMRLMGGGEIILDDYFDGEYALLTGKMEEALELAKATAVKAKFRNQVCIIISSYFIMLRCLIYLGKVTELEEKLEELKSQMNGIIRSSLVVDYELVYSYIYGCMGKNEGVADWLQTFSIEKCNRIVKNTRTACMVYGLVLMNNKEWLLLDAIADRILVPYETTIHTGVTIYGYILKAIAVHRLEGLERAKPFMNKALDLAEPDNYMISFIELSTEAGVVLEALDRKGSFLPLIKKHIKQYQNSLRAFLTKGDTITLTKREEELMHLVKAGYRNSEIGEKMNIALVTVEKNLTSIYRKLNVTNRAAAIAKLT